MVTVGWRVKVGTLTLRVAVRAVKAWATRAVRRLRSTAKPSLAAHFGESAGARFDGGVAGFDVHGVRDFAHEAGHGRFGVAHLQGQVLADVPARRGPAKYARRSNRFGCFEGFGDGAFYVHRDARLARRELPLAAAQAGLDRAVHGDRHLALDASPGGRGAEAADLDPVDAYASGDLVAAAVVIDDHGRHQDDQQPEQGHHRDQGGTEGPGHIGLLSP